ncbi:unnamed protein product [Ectocarpus sp. 13 AM-2016]
MTNPSDILAQARRRARSVACVATAVSVAFLLATGGLAYASSHAALSGNTGPQPHRQHPAAADFQSQQQQQSHAKRQREDQSESTTTAARPLLYAEVAAAAAAAAAAVALQPLHRRRCCCMKRSGRSNRQGGRT